MKGGLLHKKDKAGRYDSYKEEKKKKNEKRVC